MTPDLPTSFTLLDGHLSEPINYELFADADRYIEIRNDRLAQGILKLAMREAAKISLEVGSISTHSVVEFYAFDIKSDKHLLREIGQIVYLGLMDAFYEALRSSALLKGEFLSDALTAPLDVVSDLTDIRRFVANASSRKSSKTKPKKLLFHLMADSRGLNSAQVPGDAADRLTPAGQSG